MGYVTTYEIIAMLVIAGWLIFNAGFVAGAAWRGIFKHEDDAESRRNAPRCYPRVRV